MDDSGIIQDFLSYLTFEKRFSEHTAKCYGADLAQFSEFVSNRSEQHNESDTFDPANAQSGGLATQVHIDQLLITVDTPDVRSYLSFLNEKQYSKSTVARKLATLRSFYKFLIKRERVTSNPVAPVRTPKLEKKLPKFLEYFEI